MRPYIFYQKKKTGILLVAIFCFFTVFSQQFQPNWASLNKRKIPEWFHQDKFGIFIHWGVYSVPAYAPVIPNSFESYAEWYWYHTNQKQKDFKAFNDKNYGTDFLYPNFERQFKAEMFEPEQWATLFKESGARYVVLTSKHHEGYCLWNSADADRTWQRPWNAVTGTPKRDLLGDLSAAVRNSGLKMGCYFSLYEWFNPLWLTDKKKYVDEHMIPQFKDMVTHYKPSLIFADGEWEATDTVWRSEETLAWLFNQSPVAKEVVVNDRWGSNTRGKNTGATYTTSEYGSGKDASITWEESQGIGHSYGYNRNEKLEDYKTSEQLILMLVDIVSRGGNLLLDIGPSADGRIPVIMQQRLTDMGAWLKKNGEAIYGTTANKNAYQWSNGKRPEKNEKDFMAGFSINELIKPKKDIANIELFFTAKDKDLFCIVPNYSSKLTLHNFKVKKEMSMSILGSSKSISFKQVKNDCVLNLSGLKPGEVDSKLFVIKIKNAL